MPVSIFDYFPSVVLTHVKYTEYTRTCLRCGLKQINFACLPNSWNLSLSIFNEQKKTEDKIKKKGRDRINSYPPQREIAGKFSIFQGNSTAGRFSFARPNSPFLLFSSVTVLLSWQGRPFREESHIHETGWSFSTIRTRENWIFILLFHAFAS